MREWVGGVVIGEWRAPLFLACPPESQNGFGRNAPNKSRADVEHMWFREVPARHTEHLATSGERATRRS